MSSAVNVIPQPKRASRLLIPAAVGAVVAVVLGVFANAHHPAKLHYTLGFHSIFAMKVWLALVVGAFALLQLLSAMWMWRKLPFGAPPNWIGTAHRATGTIAFVLSLPIAYACLYAIGFEHSSPRVIAHSALGCVFYGAFVTKLVTLRTKRLPGWALPVVGGTLFTALIVVVSTSAIYTLSTTGAP
jgi:hypothetical protein